MIRNLHTTVVKMHRCRTISQQKLTYAPDVAGGTYGTEKTIGVICDCGWRASHLRNSTESTDMITAHWDAAQQGYLLRPSDIPDAGF